jgi:transposase
LRRINPVVTRILGELREKLVPFYSEIGRPSIDPELMIRMLIIGYCYGIRFERRLCEEVELHLAYRWFCRLDLDDKVPDHSTFSVNRHGRFRDSDLFRQVFEAVVRACMDAGLVKGEAFAVDASVMEADASRYHAKAPDEIDWSLPERQTRAVAEFLCALDDEDPDADRKLPKAISPVDPCSAWTAKANKRVQFGYGLNYLIDVERAVIVDVEATPARTYDEVAATKTMIKRTEQTQGLKPKRLLADTAYGTGKFLGWLVGTGITPHIPVKDMSDRDDGTFSSNDFTFDRDRNVYVCPANKLLRTTGNAAPTARCAIVHRDATAAHVHSSRNAVRTRPRARSHATSTRMPAIMPAASWVRRSSNNRATSARRSRCDLRTSKPITASSVCACGGSPGHATSSTSPPSCKTSRRSPANSGSHLPTRWQQAPCERQSHQAPDGGQKHPPIRKIEGSKAPMETRTTFIRYFINDIDPSLPSPEAHSS